MKSLATFALAALFFLGCSCPDMLDQPMRATSVDQAFDVVRKTAAMLPDHEGALLESMTYFFAAFDQHVSGELGKHEREMAFVAAFDGLTPRQLIVLGMVIQNEIVRQPDSYAEELEGEERQRREEHMRGHTLAHEHATAETLRRYGK